MRAARLAFRPWVVIAGVPFVLALGAVAWYLASPFFIRTQLVEDSPFAAPRPVSGPAIGSSGGSSGGPAAGPGGADPAAPATGIQLLGTGVFSDRDQVHRGSGQAILARTPEGAVVLRFEGFRVTNGPDLHVLLSRRERPSTHDEVYDGVYVGKLKASEGAFNYELPRDADLAGIRSVVVYCVPFQVIFTSARLTAT